MTKTSDSGKSRRRAAVRHTNGTVQPFLRGMVTHDLVERGLSFDEAYSVARALGDQLADRDEVTTAELRDLIEAQLRRSLPDRDLSSLRLSEPRPAELQVTYGGDPQPFSRGLLAQSLAAAGIDLDRAYALVVELHAELVEVGTVRIDARDLGERVAALIEEREGVDTAARYRTIRRIQRLPRPLVLYIAGATGSGKSSLAVELAPLLRIYRINATDTIRQVMRMVFSPTILPSLHRSSFELPDDLSPESTQEALIRAFEEQATRVCVGVRGVVERSIAENTNVVVEGVHLISSLVPFADLEGACYQEMVCLTTLDEEVHRSHFLARSRHERRRAEHYLDHFQAIREQQRHLLQLAEEYDIPLLDTTDRDTLVSRTLRLLTERLQRRLPWLAAAGHVRLQPIPTLLLVVDGMPDHPLRALGGRTPLQAADTPTLDRLAREGRCGLADPVAHGVVPDTASGNLALFGQSPHAMKRGPIEALGTGLDLAPGDIALRANFATLDERGWVVDRRAGRIRSETDELAAALEAIHLPGREFEDITVRVRAGTEHRLAIAVSGSGLSSAVTGSDPGDAAPAGPPLAPSPIDPDDEHAVRTARALALFETEARRILARHPVNLRRMKHHLPPANCVLTRGAGHYHRLRQLEPGGYPLSMACVSGDRTVLGIASLLGGRQHRLPGMTANLDTDLELKLRETARLLHQHHLVVLHVKGADIAAHDGRPDLKVAFLERLDRALGRFLDQFEGELRIGVASDHTTNSDTGQHAADPVPVLVWGTDIEPDAVEAFDEATVAAGDLQRFPLQLLLDRLFESRLEPLEAETVDIS